MKYWKRLFIVLLSVVCVVMAFGLKAEAATAEGSEIVASGGCGSSGDHVKWTLDSQGVLVVSGQHDMMDYDLNRFFPGWYKMRDQIVSVVIEPGVTEIGKNAFWDCRNLKEISISNTVTHIAEYALSDTGIESIFLPASVSQIDHDALGGMTASEGIWVDENNPYFCNDEYGVLYSKDKTVLYKAPASLSGSYVIPNTVHTLKMFSMSYCMGVTELTVGENVRDASSSLKIYPGLRKLTWLAPGLSSGYFWTSTMENDCIQILEFGSQTRGISADFISSCTALETITVPEENSFFRVKDNALYTKDFSQLLAVPRERTGELVVENGVTEIYTNAVYGCDDLTAVVLPETVERIGRNAFSGCVNMESINLPESLYYINDDAFANCKKLKEIHLPEKLCLNYATNVFNGCESLKEVSTPSAMVWINEGTFANCTSLEKITFNAETVLIADNILTGCTSLKEIHFLGDHPSIKENAFSGITATGYYPENLLTWSASSCKNYGGTITWVATAVNEFEDEEYTYTIPDTNITLAYHINDVNQTAKITLCNRDATGSLNIPQSIDGYTVVEIGDSAFYKCVGLTALTMPDTIKTIGNEAFFGCTRIANIVFSQNLKTIGDYAFKQTQVKTLKLPDSITTIGKGAFSNSGINTAILPKNLERIPEEMFYHSYYLHEVTFPEKLKVIGASAFNNCYELHSVTLPEGLLEIGEYAFNWCGPSTTYGMYYDAYKFKTVTLPETVEKIGKNAFAGCQELQKINLPSKLKTLESEVFYGCYSLYNITIPARIENIEKSAFGQSGVQTVTFSWNAPQIDSNAFDTRVTATCYYPGNNEAWTADMLLNYGAKALTWVAQEMEEPDDGLGGGSGGNAGEQEGDDSGEGGNTGSEGTGGGGGGTGSGDGSGTGGNTGGGDGTGGDDIGGGTSGNIDLTIDNVGGADIGAVIGTPTGGWVEGSNTFTVTCDARFVVAYSNDGGNTYTQLMPTAMDAANTFSFTIDDARPYTMIDIILVGDVNKDGKVDDKDRIYLTRYLAKWKGYSISPIKSFAADVNSDGKINNLDRMLLTRYLAGWSNCF